MMEYTICREAMRKKLEDQKESITVMRRQVENVRFTVYKVWSALLSLDLSTKLRESFYNIWILRHSPCWNRLSTKLRYWGLLLLLWTFSRNLFDSSNCHVWSTRHRTCATPHWLRCTYWHYLAVDTSTLWTLTMRGHYRPSLADTKLCRNNLERIVINVKYHKMQFETINNQKCKESKLKQ